MYGTGLRRDGACREDFRTGVTEPGYGQLAGLGTYGGMYQTLRRVELLIGQILMDP